MGMLDPQQLHTMKARPGFIAALDQSGGSTPGTLRAYGIKDGAWKFGFEPERVAALAKELVAKQ